MGGDDTRGVRAQVRAWLRTVKQPKFGVPYLELVYQPMLELLDFLRANEFRVFVCSGGGRDFMRVFAEETWGIYKENVIGAPPSTATPTAGSSGPSRSSAVSTWARASPSTSSPRPAGCPLFAGGNADVDIEMLESARFAVLINHDDADREFAYTRRPRSRWPRRRSSAGRSSA